MLNQCLFIEIYNPKKVIEFVNLAKTFETKGLLLLWNIKTHWIFMFSPLKHVLREYKYYLL
jgi:hypothetical protein